MAKRPAVPGLTYDLPAELVRIIQTALPGRSNAMRRYQLRFAALVVLTWAENRSLHAPMAIPEDAVDQVAAWLRSQVPE